MSATAGGSLSSTSSFGALLRQWRTSRRLSQLDVALEAEISNRHVSFLESGRSAPSREMVHRLAQALDVPFRDRNVLLQAAGYAPVYRESDLGAVDLADVRAALVAILRQHEPFGAWAVTRQWDLVMVNETQAESVSELVRRPVAGLAIIEPPRPNVLRLLFESEALRAQLGNWEQVARVVLSRTRREALWHRDAPLESLVREFEQRLPSGGGFATPNEDAVLVPIEVRRGDRTLRFFNTMTTLGTPLDVTLQELRIEAFHPADAETDRAVRAEAAARRARER